MYKVIVNGEIRFEGVLLDCYDFTENELNISEKEWEKHERSFPNGDVVYEHNGLTVEIVGI